MPAPTPEIGSAANRYEILAKLAEGGMAEIFLARGATAGGIERHVVLKRILRERAGDAELVRMFLDEARLAAQLQHPNVAQVFDVGRLGESYFFTMEYVHGETVRALIKRAHATGFATPIACVLAIAAGAAAGLHHAHERRGANGQPLGIVHRDVSPSNLMVTYEGHVKVVDFGVAKASGRASQTVSGTLKGKIAYLSPEQCRNVGVDRRSDLFALGVVVWELLVGEYLYRRDSDFLAMTAIVEEPVRLPSSRRRDVPPELDALVAQLLQKEPSARFQTAGELVDAVEAVAEHLGAALSPSRLARFMRESFGERPEPWVDLATVGKNLSVITVNSDLVPSLVIDNVLRAVPRLPSAEGDPDDLKPTLVLDKTGPQPAIAAPKRPTLPTTMDRPPRTPPPKSSSRGLAVAIALVMIIAAAAAAFAITRRGGSDRAGAKTVPAAAKTVPADAAVARTVVPQPAIDAAAPAVAAPPPLDAPPPPPTPIDAPAPTIAEPPIAQPITHKHPRPPPAPATAPAPTPAPPDAAADDCNGGDPMACQH